jgi:hypothetical protein
MTHIRRGRDRLRIFTHNAHRLHHCSIVVRSHAYKSFSDQFVEKPKRFRAWTGPGSAHRPSQMTPCAKNAPRALPGPVVTVADSSWHPIMMMAIILTPAAAARGRRSPVPAPRRPGSGRDPVSCHPTRRRCGLTDAARCGQRAGPAESESIPGP